MYLLEDTERPTVVPTTYGETKSAIVDWASALQQCNINKQEARNAIQEVIGGSGKTIGVVPEATRASP